MIVTSCNSNTRISPSEEVEREHKLSKEAGDFIVALLKAAKKPMFKDAIVDAYEIKCERDGMSRTDRRRAVRIFDDHYSRNAITSLINANKLERCDRGMRLL